VARTLAAALAASLFGACTSDKKDDADGGSKRPDSGVRDAGSDSGARDSAVDASQTDASSFNDGGSGDGGKQDGSAGPPDAAIVDPITAGADKPTLTTVGYFNDDLGQRVLILGRDPNGDIASYTIKFFQDTSPVGFNIDNDTDTPDVTEFTNTITPVPNEAGFFVTVDQTEEFVAAVNNVQITVTDAGGRTSDPLSATLGPAPTVTSSCNPYGFNRCSGTNVCGKSGTLYSCKSVASARSSACGGTVLTLAPPAVASVSGRVEPPSLWDPPMSCTTGELKPDRVVKLKLAAAAAKVVLSTNNANTNFDTVLYQLTTCQTQPPSCVDANCPCSDDIVEGGAPTSNKSRLVLTNLAKGDYYFVVDSRPTPALTGDWFELTVTVE